MALSDNLISYWSFDESSGSAIDAVAGVNTLTDHGSVGSGTGIISGARTFNGTNQWFSHASDASLVVGDIDFSWAGWVKLNSVAATQDFINKWDFNIPSNEYLLRMDNAEPAFRFFVSSNGQDTGNFSVVDGTTLSTGTWYYMACGHNHTTNEVWISVNNNTPTASPYSSGVFTGTSALSMGALDQTTLFLNGLLDEWGFWKRDIRSDLAELYNSGAGRDYAYISGGGGGGGLPPGQSTGFWD